MNAFSVVIFFAAAAAPEPKAWAPRNARHLSSIYVQRDKLTAADAVAGYNFGYSVAIDGGTVVVWAPYENSERGAVYVFRTSDGVQLAKLTAADAAKDDRFGISVAIDGNTVVVGAYQIGSGGPGSAYVFRTSDGGATYAEVAKLTASDATWRDFFGIYVAIDGNTVVIGAHGNDDAGDRSGSVYVFRTTDGGATYVEVAKLTASDGAALDYFGISVAIDGNTVVVGANGDDDAGSNSGSVYVFRTSDGGATYPQVAKLTAADAATNDNFGRFVAIDGDTVVVGTKYGEAAYVFRTTGGATWVEVARLMAADAAAGDYFGTGVAIDGATVVVGAPNAGNGGAVYLFLMTDDGATYAQEAKLTAADAASGDYFGGSVAIDGDTVVVGTKYGEAAYVFRTTGGATWVEVARLMAADAAAGDYFGTGVAIDGATVVVGAPNAGNGGAVYLFLMTDDGATYAQEAKLTAADAASGDYFGGSVAIYGETIVIGAVDDDGVGSSYVFAPEQPTVAPTSSGGGDGKSGGESGKSGGDKGAVAVIAGGVAAVALLLLLVGVSCFFYGRSKGSAAEPSGVNSRPESSPQPPKEEVPAEEAAVVTVVPEAEESPRETRAEEPPPPPARSWRFGRAEPEPEPEEAERPPPLSPFSALRAARERELAPLDPDA